MRSRRWVHIVHLESQLDGLAGKTSHLDLIREDCEIAVLLLDLKSKCFELRDEIAALHQDTGVGPRLAMGDYAEGRDSARCGRDGTVL